MQCNVAPSNNSIFRVEADRLFTGQNSTQLRKSWGEGGALFFFSFFFPPVVIYGTVPQTIKLEFCKKRKSFFRVYRRMKEFPFLKTLKQPQLFHCLLSCSSSLSLHVCQYTNPPPLFFLVSFSTAVETYLKVPREVLCLCSSKM